MSVNIATMGMFSSGFGTGTGTGTGVNTGGGVVMVEEKKIKPIIKVLDVKYNEIIPKNLIEVTSISSGD